MKWYEGTLDCRCGEKIAHKLNFKGRKDEGGSSSRTIQLSQDILIEAGYKFVCVFIVN